MGGLVAPAIHDVADKSLDELMGDLTDLVARADGMLLDHAESRQMTEEQLFQWANSKHGRWYGDCWFGANGQHAEKYLPKI